MTDIEIIEKIDETIKVHIPKMYNVMLHNDDRTTFDFVIYVLTSIFHKSVDDAIDITNKIHQEGCGIAGGPYTLEIAQEKTAETLAIARANGFPLVSTFEEL